MTFVFVLSMTSVFAETEIAQNQNEEAADLLNMLQIVKKVESDIDNNEEVSRAQFAVYIARITGIDEYEGVAERYFMDVSNTHWAAPAISALLKKGYISEPADKRFRPDDPISGNEAIKLLVCALGYNEYAKVAGGYPAGYLNVARELELYKNAGNSVTITHREAVMLIFNTIMANRYNLEGVIGDEIKFATTDKNILEERYNISWHEGCLNGVNGFSISGEAIKNEEIMVGKNKFRVDDMDLYSMLGRNVRVFYKMDSFDEDYGTAMLVSVYKADDKYIELDAEYTDYIDGKIRYSETREKYYNLEANFRVVKNRSLVLENLSAELDADAGTYKLIDSDKNGTYDLIIIDEYVNAVIHHVDKSTKTLYFRDNVEKLELEGNKYDILKVFNADGTSADVDSIASDDIITMYESERAMYVYVSNKKVSGAISLISEDEMVVNGVTYQVDSNFVQRYGSKISVGVNYIFSLDMYGDIAYVKGITDDSMEFGFVRNVFLGDDGDSMYIKLYSTNDDVLTYKVAEKVIVDKVSRDAVNLQTILASTGGTNYSQLIRFSLDSNNEIKYIDTIASTSSDASSSLFQISALQNLQYSNDSKMFGTKVITNGETIYFTVPTDANIALATADDYSASMKLSSGTSYNVEAYGISEDNPYAAVIVNRGSVNNEPEKNSMTLICDISTSWSEELGCAVKSIKCVRNGKIQEIYCEPSYDISLDADIGDTVIVSISKDNYVSGAEVLYDFSEKAMQPHSDLYADIGAANRYSFGTINSVKQDVVRWGYTDASVIDEVASVSDITIMVYDQSKRKNSEKAYIGTISDIIDYETNAGEASQILVYTKWGNALSAVIYK